MVDADDLERAYDRGFSDAESDVIDYGKKRWMDPAGFAGSEEEYDSYWNGYEAYELGIVVEDVHVEYTADGALITGTIPEIARQLMEAQIVKGFSIG